MRERRLRLAFPFTCVREGERLHLVAGEELRYTLHGAGGEAWVEDLFRQLDGSRTLSALLEDLEASSRDDAEALVTRLVGERAIVIDERPRAPAGPLAARVEGQGPLVERLSALLPHPTDDSEGGEETVAVLCQDRLDYAAAVAFQRRCLEAARPALWVSTGAMGRGWVSPLVLPRDGPCLVCLVTRFRGLSPFPELYEALRAHVEAGGEVLPTPFPAPGVEVLAQLARWKLELAREEAQPSALFRLHVLEVGDLTVSDHELVRVSGCEACAEWR